MRRRTIQLIGITVTLVLVVAAAGCGGKKKPLRPTTTTETTATTTTESTTTSAAGRPRAAVPAFATAANCKQLSDLDSQFFRPCRREGRRRQGGRALKAFADKTPEEIRPDFETIADAYATSRATSRGST